MGVMVKVLAISLRSGNSTFAPSGMHGHICTQVNENLEREYRVKSRSDKIGITWHIMMHQVLYNVHVTVFIGQLHNI